VLSVVEKSTQALFTSHSPYVLEEFSPDNILTITKYNGELCAIPAGMPPAVKPKKYREEFRKRFCESLLSRRVLITEGRTEYDVYMTAARKLQSLHPNESYTFELLGISLVNAETDTQISIAIIKKPNNNQKRRTNGSSPEEKHKRGLSEWHPGGGPNCGFSSSAGWLSSWTTFSQLD